LKCSGLIIIVILNTFRSRRSRQNELQETEGAVQEVPDDDEVEEVLDDDDAKVEKLNIRKRKKGNTK
jgi:hypothetical protein